jgi:DNA-binding transcriptional LysR family regulator
VEFYYKKNRLQQLKGFYYTALLGSPTKAAEKMFLSQAAISMQITSLEKDLRIDLFTRKNNKLILTKEGKMLYEIAVPHIQGLEQVSNLFNKKLQQTKENIINIAANHVSISYILPKYIRKLKNEYKNIKLKICNISKGEALTRLINNEIDMIVYPFEVKDIPQECNFIPIIKYQPSLVLNRDHPLASKKNVSLSDVAQYELIRIDPHLITLPAFEELVMAHKLQSNIEFEQGDWEILKKFVAAKIGVAIISNICLISQDKDLVAIPLTHYFPEMVYGICVKKSMQHSKSLISFINFLTNK